MTETVPYGAWPSPITPERLTQGAVSIGQISATMGRLYWTEMRPWEGGRSVLVERGADGEIRDLTADPINVRSRVHEYGGSAFCVGAGAIWFVEGNDGRLFRADPGTTPVPITRPGRRSYADMIVDHRRGRLITVCEENENGGEPENYLASVAFTGEVTSFAAGADFYACPRLSPDGRFIVWLEWDHPNMPWDGTRLVCAELDADGDIIRVAEVAGGADESIFQPTWSPDGALFYVSDKTGFWNLYGIAASDLDVKSDVPLAARATHYPAKGEFGMPLWQFGMSTYAFVDAKTICAVHAIEGDWSFVLVDIESGTMSALETPFATASHIVGDGDGRVWFVGGYAAAPDALVGYDPVGARIEVVKNTADISDIPSDGISVAEKISFPTTNGNTAYAYYYPPANADCVAPEGTLPPLIVKGHGGPTSQTTCDLSLKIQYWTSRGFAVADVNYGGSTGFGREYRCRLDGNWGIVDVEDCVHAARYLAERGKIDPNAMAITGGSAGGFTTLAALTFHDVFKAGCSAYGIGDLVALTRDTHKFESQYTDRLVGKWPDASEIYRARSPLNHTEQLSCPVIFLQGSDDKVVPPNQAEEMVNALKRKKLPVAYILFDGEGHGFRKAENIKRALEAELSFYGQVFGFEPADDLTKVEIDNLK